jgi:hypothetical protein
MAKRRGISRRDLLKTASALGACVKWPALVAGETIALRFFTPDEHAMVAAMSDHIIPADAQSPGAKAARVAEFTDLIVSVSPDGTKRAWRDGLQAVDRKSVEMFGVAFLQASARQQVELLTAISANERRPVAAVERFFVRIKNATIDAYYTSRIGVEQEIARMRPRSGGFSGCVHPEHR